jgi:hypothetical protein
VLVALGRLVLHFSMKTALTDQDFENAANDLGCDVAAVKAVSAVESRGSGFLPDGRPVVLFERHLFSRISKRKYDKSNPDISNPKPGGYEGGKDEWDRLAKAMILDREAALMSASWGKFQILGQNYLVCGFRSVEEFVAAMSEDEANQLSAFVNFVRGNGLDDELQRHDWAGFARGYNGASYRKNAYDKKLAAAYLKHGGKESAGAGPILQGSVSLPPVPTNPQLIVASGDQLIGTSITPPPAEGAPLPPAPVVKESAQVSAQGDPPAQLSVNGAKALWTNVSAQIGGLGVGAIGFFQNNRTLIIVAGSLMGLALILWFTRTMITDYMRMKLGADPTKFNVQ